MLDDLYPEIIDPQIHNERQRQHINILSLEKIAYIKKQIIKYSFGDTKWVQWKHVQNLSEDNFCWWYINRYIAFLILKQVKNKTKN